MTEEAKTLGISTRMHVNMRGPTHVAGALKAVLEDVKPGAKVVDLCRKGDKIIEECVPHSAFVSEQKRQLVCSGL